MFAFLITVTLNAILFIGFLGVSVAHANGDNVSTDFETDTETAKIIHVIETPEPEDALTAFIIENIHFPENDIKTRVQEPAQKPPAAQRRPCFDKGFDVIIIEQARLNGTPVVIEDFKDDDSLQINYLPTTDANGETVVPQLSVVNFADDTGAYIRLDGKTVVEVPDGQFMSPDNINLVAV
jgi:hypothetical protein